MSRISCRSRANDAALFKSFYDDFDTWQNSEPPRGTLYNYPPRGDEMGIVAGAPARPDVACQIYTAALQPVMVSKTTQGGEPIAQVIKWAERELEGSLRA